MEQALKTDKNSLFNWAEMSLVYYYNGQPDRALKTMETAYQLFPNVDFLFTEYLRLFVYTAKYDKAVDLFKTWSADQKLEDQIPYNLGLMGIAYHKTGQNNRTSDILSVLLTKSKSAAVGSPSFFTASVYTAMGENDNALKMLEKAYSDHEVEMYWLNVEPLFKPLHGDPRFENILMKIGFK